MKRKIDQNRPSLGKIPWRTMLGAVILFFFASLNSSAQTATLYQAQLDQQLSIQPWIQSNGTPAEIQANAEMIASLQAKLAPLQGTASAPTSSSYDAQVAALQAQIANPASTPQEVATATNQLYLLQVNYAKMHGLTPPPPPSR